MQLNEISKALAQGQRLSARYRDQYGFITNGVILGIEGNKDRWFNLFWHGWNI